VDHREAVHLVEQRPDPAGVETHQVRFHRPQDPHGRRWPAGTQPLSWAHRFALDPLPHGQGPFLLIAAMATSSGWTVPVMVVQGCDRVPAPSLGTVHPGDSAASHRRGSMNP
jgi:hypothetical protein